MRFDYCLILLFWPQISGATDNFSQAKRLRQCGEGSSATSSVDDEPERDRAPFFGEVYQCLLRGFPVAVKRLCRRSLQVWSSKVLRAAASESYGIFLSSDA